MTSRMITFGAIGALVLAAGAAQAQVYDGYLPPAPYASSGADFTRGEACGGFTLAGARAGVTVLGVDIDAGAGLRIGTSVGCGSRAPARYAPPPPTVYAPPPVYTPEPGYAPMPPPAYEPEPRVMYRDEARCDCSPAPVYRAPSRYGW